jgi:hypothetical protein
MLPYKDCWYVKFERVENALRSAILPSICVTLFISCFLLETRERGHQSEFFLLFGGENIGERHECGSPEDDVLKLFNALHLVIREGLNHRDDVIKYSV